MPTVFVVVLEGFVDENFRNKNPLICPLYAPPIALGFDWLSVNWNTKIVFVKMSDPTFHMSSFNIFTFTLVKLAWFELDLHT